MTDWRLQIPAPRLRHSHGAVLIDLDGKSVAFPSEAAARFFYEAYRLIPELHAKIEERDAQLASHVDDAAKIEALRERVAKLEEHVKALDGCLVDASEARAKLVQRVRTLGAAQRRVADLQSNVTKLQAELEHERAQNSRLNARHGAIIALLDDALRRANGL